MAEAISSASPGRPMEMRLVTRARFSGSSTQARLMGVTVAPGPIALTRMFR